MLTHVFFLFCPQCCRTFPCFSWSLVDVLTRIVLTGNYKKKILLTLSLFVSAIKCLTWSHNDIVNRRHFKCVSNVNCVVKSTGTCFWLKRIWLETNYTTIVSRHSFFYQKQVPVASWHGCSKIIFHQPQITWKWLVPA